MTATATGWTSADAAGLPILPGLVRLEEVMSGEIRHALRFTVPETQKAFVWPARHHASSLTGSQYPPMGQRFRLRADYDLSGFSTEVQVISALDVIWNARAWWNVIQVTSISLRKPRMLQMMIHRINCWEVL